MTNLDPLTVASRRVSARSFHPVLPELRIDRFAAAKCLKEKFDLRIDGG